MRVVVESTFYSEGMGYTENCLPKALAALGHDVHVVTSNLNVYGNSKDYDSTYRQFLGPADQGTGEFEVDGYTVHRLPARLVGGYVMVGGLYKKLRDLEPAVVHCLEIASVQTFRLAAGRVVMSYKLFSESHQHLSVVRPYLKSPGGSRVRKGIFWSTRTLPASLASRAVERCYVISPDCGEVARRFYAVPEDKIVLRSLGTDTELFRPVSSPDDRASREQVRTRLGFNEQDIVCVYTGQLSTHKNPRILATAAAKLAEQDSRFKALFVGDGPQREEIAATPQAMVLPFMRHGELANLYRAADIAVWPRQETMSMLDAAASGLPIVVSAAMADSDRVVGAGRVYREDSVEDLASTLQGLSSVKLRRQLGQNGRQKMVERYSWSRLAGQIVTDYDKALNPNGA